MYPIIEFEYITLQYFSCISVEYRLLCCNKSNQLPTFRNSKIAIPAYFSTKEGLRLCTSLEILQGGKYYFTKTKQKMYKVAIP